MRTTALLSLAAFIALPAAAQEGTPQGGDIVVTATRIPLPAEQVASSVTVIDQAELERRQIRNVADAIRAAPGLYLAQNGGAGKQARAFLRGAESRHTLVLVDGIEIQDPSSPDGAYDFQHLDATDIERIEVLRGPQSSLYGSDAIGGVVNIITRRGKGPPAATASIEGGSFFTHAERAGISGSQGPFHYRLNVGYLRSEGTSVTPKRLRPAGARAERDGYENLTVSSRFGVDIADNAEINVALRYVDTESELDVRPEDPNSIERTNQFFGRVEGKASLFGDRLDSKLGFSYTLYDRRDRDPADRLSADFSRANNRSSKEKFDWQNDIRITDAHTLTLGLETERESARADSRFSSGFASRTDEDARTNAGFAQLQSGFFERFFVTGSVRVDDHENFAAEPTWRIAPAYLLRETGTKFKGSYGTGYRAPTLFQLHGASFFGNFGIFNGNPDLKPETSRGFDVGFEQTLWQGRIVFGASYFQTRIRDLIDFNQTFSSLVNIDRTRTEGVESFISLRPFDSLEIRIDHTYADSKNEETDQQLLRRPRNKGSLAIDWRPVEKASVSLTGLHVGRRTDVDAVTFARKRTDAYTVFNLAGSYDILPSLTLFARIENLFDKDYEDPDGFRRPGIAAFGGLRARF
ncbi:MAG: TonB-dependent receptor [Alphaproteobacteria bacterium]|nr:TonB-dependent receptor [Alphaproteobacteria bacterium]